MDRSDPTITCILASNSQESLRRAKQLAKREIDFEKVFTDVAIAFPNGVEERTTQHHRLGDFFNNVQVLDDSPDSISFRLVFQPREGAGRYWKDLMAQILWYLEDAGDVFVKSISNSS